jgi:hypothetical protein
MSSGLASDTDTGQGVLFYLTGSGGIDLSANSDATLVGSSSAGPYKGILFFGDRAAPARSHTIGGGGAISLTGTLYLNNTTMTSTIYQTLNLSGNGGSSTTINGQIIVSKLAMGGTPSITMNLNNSLVTLVRRVALVK